jgi:hypothetical protein
LRVVAGWDDEPVFPHRLAGLQEFAEEAQERQAAPPRIVVFFHDADPLFVLLRDR